MYHLKQVVNWPETTQTTSKVMVQSWHGTAVGPMVVNCLAACYIAYLFYIGAHHSVAVQLSNSPAAYRRAAMLNRYRQLMLPSRENPHTSRYITRDNPTGALAFRCTLK